MKVYLTKITWDIDASSSVYTNKPFKSLAQAKQIVPDIQCGAMIDSVYFETKEINVVELD